MSIQDPVVEYTVCEGNTPMQLSRSVMKAIRDGWQPHGSMVTADEGDDIGYYQPMVRREKDEDGE